MVFSKKIRIEENRIKTVKTWLKPQSVRDIQVLLDFVNFFKRFIKNFSRIAILVISILKTILLGSSLEASKISGDSVSITINSGRNKVDSEIVGRIENLSISANSAQSKSQI